nr:methyltransferase [Brucella pituitosa]
MSLGQTFIAAAASRLKTGGRLLMVANRQLPYEATLKSLLRT